MESALRGMAQANIDLGDFQETKFTEGIYTRKSAGYRVVATDAPADTAAGWRYSTGHRHYSWWRQ